MQIGMIGLGKMGANMVRRLMTGGHEVHVHDRDPSRIKELVDEGAIGAGSLAELAKKMEKPRAVWIMVPAGGPTENTVTALMEVLEPEDIIIDGGNTYFKDDVRRAKILGGKNLHYIDVGTSGGVWGLERGYCLMIGGKEQVVKYLDPIFHTLAPGQGKIDRTPGRGNEKSTAENGYVYCGPPGAGHFVKMVHNGIEYGIMQAYAEGFDILKNARTTTIPEDYRYTLQLEEIAEVWRRGSVIGSWLLDLIATALLEDPALKEYDGYVQDSGEGRWTVMTAIEEAVPVDVLSAALYARFRSRQDHTFAEKLLSAMRYQFGGHVEKK